MAPLPLQRRSLKERDDPFPSFQIGTPPLNSSDVGAGLVLLSLDLDVVPSSSQLAAIPFFLALLHELEVDGGGTTSSAMRWAAGRRTLCGGEYWSSFVEE
jgi:hypothetical protein